MADHLQKYWLLSTLQACVVMCLHAMGDESDLRESATSEWRGNFFAKGSNKKSFRAVVHGD